MASPPTAILEKHYSRLCPASPSLRPVTGSEINSHNWFVQWPNEPRPRFVLKRKSGTPSDPFARSISEYARATQKTGLFPKLLPTDTAELFVFETDTIFRLMEFRDGEPFSGSRAELHSCGAALAEVHRALQGSQFGESDALYRNLSETERSQILQSRAADLGPGDFGERAVAWVATEASACYAEMAFLEAQPDLQRQSVHHDFLPQNLVFKAGRVAAVLDPDSLVLDFPLQAIAFAASRLMPGRLSWEFVAGYHSVTPLTAKQLRLVPAFARREAVRRINWIVRVNLLLGDDRWRADFFKHARNIEITRNWDSELNISDQDLLKRMTP